MIFYRLQAYDKNDNFKDAVINILEANPMPDWPESGFKQITEGNLGQLPAITEHHVTGYLTLRMTLDKMANSDSQAVLKGQLLLESERLEACSFQKGEATLYITGICVSAMSKVIIELFNNWHRLVQY